MALMNLTRAPGRPASSSELRDALAACAHAFIGIALMSGLINILYLTGSFYMLEIYDRGLPSRNVPTLVALSILALTLFTFQGVLDVIRSRVLVRIAASLDERLSSRVYDIVVQLPLRSRMPGDGLAPLRDLDQIRTFLIGTGPLALFDLPWMPFYILICFLFHPWIGVAALIGAMILTSLTLLSEFMTRKPSRAAMGHVGQRNALAEASRRNAEVIRAMGMAPRMATVWGEANTKYLSTQRQTSDVAGGLGAVSKVLRFALQSGVLGLGAYLHLPRLRSGAAKLAPPVCPPDRHRSRRAPDDTSPAEVPPGRGECDRNPARHSTRRRAGCQLYAQSGAGARHHRAQCLRQVFPRKAHCRRMDTDARQGAARWRGARPVVAGPARTACRASAGGRPAVRRDGRPEYRPVRAGCALGSRDRSGPGRRRA